MLSIWASLKLCRPLKGYVRQMTSAMRNSYIPSTLPNFYSMVKLGFKFFHSGKSGLSHSHTMTPFDAPGKQAF